VSTHYAPGRVSPLYTSTKREGITPATPARFSRNCWLKRRHRTPLRSVEYGPRRVYQLLPAHVQMQRRYGNEFQHILTWPICRGNFTVFRQCKRLNHYLKQGKVKQPLLRGRGGLQGCEMSRFQHSLNKRLTDGGEVVSLTRRPRFIPQKHSRYTFLSTA
jgi:hypothetical protein